MATSWDQRQLSECKSCKQSKVVAKGSQFLPHWSLLFVRNLQVLYQNSPSNQIGRQKVVKLCQSFGDLTSRGGRMSCVPASRSGRSGNPKIVGLSPEPATLKPGPRTCSFETWLSQTNDFKIDTCHFPAWHSALLG